MSGDRRFPRADAIAVTRELISLLQPCCSRLLVAGSLRRRKPDVGDIELVFIPHMIEGTDPEDMFGKKIAVNAMDFALDLMIKEGLLSKRPSKDGRTAWGPKNKFAVHQPSGIPIDFFTGDVENWWNLVVCRTGGAQSNVEIAGTAKRAGWNWNPYGMGFSRPNPERVGWWLIKPIHSEQEVFEFVGLPYRDPWERE
jgi:DNA polymerase/3'-5' exonuclease PolX